MTRKRQSEPKRATAAYLERVGLWYLTRYGGSEYRLRIALQKRVERSVREHGTNPREGAEHLETVVRRLKELGYIDDSRLAASRVAALRKRGKATRSIAATLQSQGLDKQLVENALRACDTDDLEAARALVRRKRWRPVEGDAEERHAVKRKRLASLARQGFSFDVAQRVLTELAEGEDEVL